MSTGGPNPGEGKLLSCVYRVQAELKLPMAFNAVITCCILKLHEWYDGLHVSFYCLRVKLSMITGRIMSMKTFLCVHEQGPEIILSFVS